MYRSHPGEDQSGSTCGHQAIAACDSLPVSMVKHSAFCHATEAAHQFHLKALEIVLHAGADTNTKSQDSHRDFGGTKQISKLLPECTVC